MFAAMGNEHVMYCWVIIPIRFDVQVTRCLRHNWFRKSRKNV